MASFRKRGNSWQYEISYKKTDGSYGKIRKSGFKTKKAAKFEADEIENDLKKGYNAELEDLPLYEYFGRWFDTYKKGVVSDITALKYRDTYRSLKKYAPELTVKTLDRLKYQELLNKYALTHAKETTGKLNTQIRAALNDAIIDGYITINPTLNAVIKGGKPSKKSSEKYINYSELKQLINFFKTDWESNKTSYTAILLCSVTGVRVAELLGLTWDNINLKTGRISIEKSWDYKLKSGFKSLKNDSSERVIFIDEEMIAILKKYKEFQEEYSEENLLNNVFYHKIYGVPTPENFNKHIKKFCVDNEIEPIISIHGLRHTFASALLYKGVSVFKVSKILGHKNVSVTQSVYTHIIKELDDLENDKIKELQNELFV